MLATLSNGNFANFFLSFAQILYPLLVFYFSPKIITTLERIVQILGNFNWKLLKGVSKHLPS
jgi:hypothetical protein